MSDLKKIRELYLEKNTQFLIVNTLGRVIESDDILFDCPFNTSLSDIHPFFVSLNLKLIDEALDFSCVHLDIGNKSLICDISIKTYNSDILFIISDFSAHYNSFQSLAQSRNETAISSEFIALDNDLLQQKEVFKNKFISNFNHELVSPILSILTFSDILKKTNLTPDQKDYLEIISSSSVTLKSMVNDIFDISKIETGNLEIIPKRFSLRRLIKVIKSEYKERCRLKQITLNVIYGENMPTYIVSDKLRLKQIIANLLDNAIKYTNSGTVTLSIESIYRRARKITYTIKVIDTGIGIDTQDHDFIFERFTRLKINKHIPGTGLGLAITKDIVNLMEGEIHLQSQLEMGSAFTITLRATTPLDTSKEDSKNTLTKNITSTKKEILIVDDSYADQLSIFKILAATKNYFIDISTTADEAIKLNKQKKYDLILMDYKLDSLNGLEVSKSINSKARKKTPIILVTGLKLEKALIEHYKPYIATIIYKPFEVKTLLEHIDLHIK